MGDWFFLTPFSTLEYHNMTLQNTQSNQEVCNIFDRRKAILREFPEDLQLAGVISLVNWLSFPQ